MAFYYTTIDKRDGTAITATNDNISDVANELANMSISGEVVTVSGTAGWNGTLDGDATVVDLVAFNKRFVFNDTSARFYSTGVAGCHHYYVNCTFQFDSYTGVGSDTLLGTASAHNGDGAGQRAASITNEATSSTANFYNCTFIFNDATDSGSPGIIFGDMINSSTIYPANSRGCTFFIQGGGKWDTYTHNAQGVVPAANPVGFGTMTQLFSDPAELKNLTVLHQVFQNAEDNIRFTDFAAQSRVTWSSASSAIPQLFGQAGISSSCAMISPKADLNQDGAIWWRNADASDDSANVDSLISLCKRFGQVYFSNPEHTTGRKDVRLIFDGNVNYATAGSMRTLPINDALKVDTYRDYVTEIPSGETGGVPFGRYDHADGTLYSTDTRFDNIDVPLISLRADNTGTASDKNANDSITFSTDVREFSLWGTTFSNNTYDNNDIRGAGNSDNNLKSADADGYYITPEVGNVYDPPDPFMEQYNETITNVTAPLTAATGVVSFNDLIANYKLCAWDGTLPVSTWSQSIVDGNHADISSQTINSIRIAGNQNEACARPDNNTVSYKAPEDSNDIVTIEVDPTDTDQIIQELTVADFHNGHSGTYSEPTPSASNNVTNTEVGLAHGSLSDTNTVFLFPTVSGSQFRIGGYATIGSDWNTVREIRPVRGAGETISPGGNNEFALNATGVLALYVDDSNWALWNATKTRVGNSDESVVSSPAWRIDGLIDGYGSIPADATAIKFEIQSSLSNIDGYSASTDESFLRFVNGKLTITSAGNLRDIKRFDNIPTALDTDNSIEGTEIHGDIQLNGANNSVYVLHDIPSASAITLSTPSGNTNSYDVVISGTTDPDSITNNDTDNITVNRVIQWDLELPAGETADITKQKIYLASSATNTTPADSAITKIPDADITVSGNVMTITTSVNGDHDYFWWVAAVDGYEITGQVARQVGPSDTMLVAIEEDNLNFATTNFDTWGTYDVSATGGNVTVTAPTSAYISDSSDTTFADHFSVELDYSSGTSISASDAPSAKVRLWLRRVLLENESIMKAMAKGFIKFNVLEFFPNFVSLYDFSDDDNTTRFTIFRTVNAGGTATATWTLGIQMVKQSNDEDLYDDLTNASIGRDIEFLQVTTGLTLAEVRSVINEQTEELFGTPSGGTDRSLSDVYGMAKKARDTNFI